ncbi:MAG TPA: penicillin-binding protein 1A [Thiobacillaceae bacterium]|nr:penicillin-binding protein 1A [Thiobacillaceae bacterium]
MMLDRWWQILLALILAAGLAVVGAVALAAALIFPSLPSLDALTNYQPKMPLRVFTEDGALIGEFGEERRAFVRLGDTPLLLRRAILAAEDERFYQHGGVDTLGVLRAAVANLTSGGVKEGASTITMQVARNFFLSSEKTVRRKLNETLLAFKIERTLSKDQILEIYINHIYLGQRAYGFAAAAQIYFGKPLKNISLAEAAMLAGLPKAPSAYNPVANPRRAKSRQAYVLGRMLKLGYITEGEYAQAKDLTLQVQHSARKFEVQADHAAEMARQYMYKKYGEDIYVSGMKVYTTLLKRDQTAAAAAIWRAVADFNRRRGYAGPEGFVELPTGAAEANKAAAEALEGHVDSGGMDPAVVLAVDGKRILARLRDGRDVELGISEVGFAKRYLDKSLPAQKRLRRGSLIRVLRGPGKQWELNYLPRVEAAFIAVSPRNSAVRALVGGVDFARNQYNHILQAWRQPGSSIKPFIYSAALERGLMPATVFDDSPFSVDPAETGGELWEPKNFDNTTEGPMTMRNALVKSKNLVSIRVLQETGIDLARTHLGRFGFDVARIPPYLTMALGAIEVTPMHLVSAYATLANGGHRIKPYFISRVTDKDGRVLEQYQGSMGEQVIDPRNAFLMTSMLKDVVRRGTAARAAELGRGDLAGKTGTTNDTRDAWFAGYNPERVAVAWVGYDQPRPLGYNETGSVAALPIWMGYMRTVLAGTPEQDYAAPDGIVVRLIDAQNGMLLDPGQSGVPEYFYQEFLPGQAEETDPLSPKEGAPIEDRSAVRDPAGKPPEPPPTAPNPAAPAKPAAAPAWPAPFAPPAIPARPAATAPAANAT